MRLCSQLADTIEQAVVAFLEWFTILTQTVCRTVTRIIEEWHRRWEERWVAVTRRVCSRLPWPLNRLCRWVTEQVRRLVEVVVRVVRTIVETICEVIVSVVRSIVRVVMTVVTVLRFVCFWVGFIVNWIWIIRSAIMGIPEFLTCLLLGVRVRKHLHICVTVLADLETRQPVVNDTTVSTTIDGAAGLISELANVHVHEHDRRVIAVNKRRLTVRACDARQLLSSEAVDLSAEANQRARFEDFLVAGETRVIELRSWSHRH